ncbi:DNA polymerase III subunit epsilon [Salipaludibacillus keqinensis]|uniref:DNA polymerase III subunit epsilon n=1 Tax=Salipaludibacillus keqinensis TaxID=2045207 RepID=A0A323TKC7_9BACI|nr:3'-5' exonuclease [Salipaludibacillus keqinensis]PYZ95368.1 DNA polymerase III subunit epsilon [Salipaludibacillus keqinensis]
MFWKKKRLSYQLTYEQPLNTPIRDLSIIVFDTEATGFAVGADDRLIEIGAVQVDGLTVTDQTFQTYVNPERDIPKDITELTGIQMKDVEGAPTAIEAIESFYQYMETSNSIGWVGHYLAFDVLVLKKELKREKFSFDEPLGIDTLDLIGYLSPSWDMQDLEHYARTFGTNIYKRHSALGDALTTANLYVELLLYLEDRGKTVLGDLIVLTKKDGIYPV